MSNTILSKFRGKTSEMVWNFKGNGKWLNFENGIPMIEGEESGSLGSSDRERERAKKNMIN